MTEERKFMLMIECAFRLLPEGAEEEMLFPVANWNFHGEGDGDMFVWGVWREDGIWTVNEFYIEGGWGCNTDAKSSEDGLYFVEAWLSDNAPDYAQMYFPKTKQ